MGLSRLAYAINEMVAVDGINDTLKPRLDGGGDFKNRLKILEMMDDQSLQTKKDVLPENWQSLATAGPTVGDYLTQLSTNTLQHFLAFPSTGHVNPDPDPEPDPEIDKCSHDNANGNSLSPLVSQEKPPQAFNYNGLDLDHDVCRTSTIGDLNNFLDLVGTTVNTKTRRRRKTKADTGNQKKEKKPRPKPGEIRTISAHDGSTLYGCPECNVSSANKETLEKHVVTHATERRFICDICGAGLKRKDHLTRHKQSHNPERPFVCTVCQKAFKRKEQLTLHFVIHSGEKRHICHECGKGFYRKDHLRKHIKSHIARRIKAEMATQIIVTKPPPVSLAQLELS